ncbi:hypothetical protein GCM10025858_33480 [Alicyclobacillus sacchari]|nr:formyltransferase family protein [Alicyclobacillus sacchari]GMA58845.1 hypothetical protein GCM10025858_33480 [Alicyclobacillus sacchari]
MGADILVTAAYGQLLPERVLNLAKAGAVNVHASLLPRWRGAAPIQRAILAAIQNRRYTHGNGARIGCRADDRAARVAD